MKATPQNPKIKLLQDFEKGEIDLRELKANQLEIGTGLIHFCIKGYEDHGCISPIQIDEIVGEEETLVPCKDAYFYTPSDPGSMILAVGTAPYNSSMSEYPRKPSIYAHLAVMDEIGNMPPGGWTPAEEETRNRKIEIELTSKRESLKNI